jgi:hypothetical protein
MLRQRANPIIIERKLLGHSLLKLLKKTFTNYSIVKEYETRLQKSNRNAAAATIWGAPPATGELM